MVGWATQGVRGECVTVSTFRDFYCQISLNIILVHCGKGSSTMIKTVTVAQRQKEHVQFWGSGRDSEWSWILESFARVMNGMWVVKCAIPVREQYEWVWTCGKHIQAITLSSGELFCPLVVVFSVFLYSFNFSRCIRLYWVGEWGIRLGCRLHLNIQNLLKISGLC